MRRLPGSIVWLLTLLGTFGLAFWLGRRSYKVQETSTVVNRVSAPAPQGSEGLPPTLVYAHNLLLQKGPHFRVYIRWIRGEMICTKQGQNPSFDNPDSFTLEIQKGVVNVKLSDLADFLNAGTTGQAPLKNITLRTENAQLQLRGTLHKLISLPVQLNGVLTPTSDGRLQYHLVKLNVLKVPLKGLLGVFHLGLSDLIKSVGTPGVQISGNDVYFDTQKLLPPPHIHGSITNVIMSGTDLQVIYGGAKNDEARLAKWHNFLRLTGGSLDFGKLTMRQVDLTMIDASDDPWFDLDLVNYQAQLVYGTTRITPKAGLEIYMPDVDDLPRKQAVQAVTLQWLKNRDSSPPINVPAR